MRGGSLALKIQGNQGIRRAVTAVHRNQRDLSKSTAVLSSGLRIHETAVDGAGSAVALKMSAKTQALQQSIRNAIHGRELIHKESGRVDTVVELVHNMREVATASASDTMSVAGRASAQKQFLGYYQEMVRIGPNGHAGTDTTSIQIGDKNNADNRISIETMNLHPTYLGLGTTNIGSSANAQTALEQLDGALDTLNNYRAQFGATESRLEHVENHLQNYVANMKGARSKVLDADYARETAQLTKRQMAQQTSLAILGQAKQLGASALELVDR